MLLRRPLPHSLTGRIALAVLAFSLAGLWSLAWYADHRLRQDMRLQLQAHQQTLAALLARELERTLQERSDALQAVARRLFTQAQADQPAGGPELQARLSHLNVLQQMFSGGYYVTDAQGQAIASYPAQLGPLLRRLSSSHATRQALAGQTVVSEPMAGLVGGRPVVAIATPVSGHDGRTAGALVGVVKLRDAGLLHPLPAADGEPAASYAVVDRASRTVVVASAEQRILQSLPAPGEDPELDALLAGTRASAIHAQEGVQVLSSAQHLHAVDWLVLVSQPSAQAYAPLDAMRQHILLATLLLTLLTLLMAGGAAWMLRCALRPAAAGADRPPPGRHGAGQRAAAAAAAPGHARTGAAGAGVQPAAGRAAAAPAGAAGKPPAVPDGLPDQPGRAGHHARARRPPPGGEPRLRALVRLAGRSGAAAHRAGAGHLACTGCAAARALRAPGAGRRRRERLGAAAVAPRRHARHGADERATAGRAGRAVHAVDHPGRDGAPRA